MDKKIFTTVDADDVAYNLVIEWRVSMSKSNIVREYPVTVEFTYMLSEKQDEVITSLYKENSTGEEYGYSWKLIEIK